MNFANIYLSGISQDYLSTYIANNKDFSQPYIGFIREIRQWFTVRSYTDIRNYRFQQIPTDVRTKMKSYFALRMPYFSGTLPNMITPEISSISINLQLKVPYGQPMQLYIWKYDPDIVLCPQYSLYIYGCCLPIVSIANITMSQQNNYLILDSQVKFQNALE